MTLEYLKLKLINIYIPIWFYFNLKEVVQLRLTINIYIPIWFYFNGLLPLLTHSLYVEFTFQYGSTLIDKVIAAFYTETDLHSNMVLL